MGSLIKQVGAWIVDSNKPSNLEGDKQLNNLRGRFGLNPNRVGDDGSYEGAKADKKKGYDQIKDIDDEVSGRKTPYSKYRGYKRPAESDMFVD